MNDSGLISPPLIRRIAIAALGVFSLFLFACDIQRAPEKETANTQQTPAQSSPAATPTARAAIAGKTWNDIPASKPENRITVHYHRHDESYEDANLWTWDSYQKNTPKQNALTAIGRDDFGLVFQFDRESYGGSDKIGLIPRIGSDWSRKDGADKFWTPALGNEVWLTSGKNEVYAKRPDLSPRVETAYLDAPNQIVVRLTKPAPLSTKVSILDDQKSTVHEAAPVMPKSAARTADGAGASMELTVRTDAPLDIVNQRHRIRVDGFGEAVPLTPRGLLDNRELFFDTNARLGAIYAPQATTFRIFAPTAKSVNLVLYDEASGDKGRTVQALKQQSKGLWDATVNGDLRGKFYAYLLDGHDLAPSREVLDPYAVNAVANSTRGRIMEMGAPVGAGPRVQSPTDMIVYEMHVRDFTIAPTSGVQNRGLYLGWTEPNTRLTGDAQMKTALDHLSELGVTHVQILPVHDFENDEASRKYNWGYVTNAFFSPEGLFATNLTDDSRVRELKALIAALHARGIGVILDVVYNHTAENAPFPFVVPHYYYRRMPDGSLANGSACGNEFRSEAPMGRKLIIDSLKFWAKEYGVDGFRFDLMALIDHETMREAERELRAINPNIVLYGEPWAAAATPLNTKTDKDALRQVPVGAFNDDFRNALKGSPDGHDPGFIQNGSNREALRTAMLVSGWCAAPWQSINYMTCHDNLVLYDKLKASMPGASEQQLKETMKLGYLALFTAQGVPFIHGGEEFARTKGGNHNSYAAPDSINQVDWTLKRKNFDLFTYVRDVIALRKAHPVFRLRTREEIAARLRFENVPNEKTLVFTLDGNGVPGETWKRTCVVLNSNDQANVDVTLPAGQWSIALDERGSALNRSVSGKVTVRQKSGLVLYQR